MNDLLDLSADRQHPRKRTRPFAAGLLPLPAGMLLSPALALVAFAAAALLQPRFALVLLGYFLLTIGYSLALKQIAMLDVVVLAALYTMRIIAGTVIIGVGLSFWLLAFSMFFFLSLAVLKRYTEIMTKTDDGQPGLSGRGYLVSDRNLLLAFGTAAGYLSVLVLALYIDSTASISLYRDPHLLWLTCPILLYWISRIWLIAHRGRMHDDPVVFAATDWVSAVMAVLVAVIALLATR